MCGIDVRKRAFHTLEKCKEFFVWFSGSDECVEKCEEIRCSQFHTSKMWGNWRWAGEMWGNPFITSENVRKYSKSLLAINFNVRNFPHVWNWCKEKSIWATDTKNNTLDESFRIWFFLLSWSFLVFRWPWRLNFNAMWQKPIFCVPEIGWESVISLPSEVASGSLLRLLKFLLVFKLAVRFAAGSALVLMRRAPAQYLCLPCERSWSVAGHDRDRPLSLCPRGSQAWSEISRRS